MNPGPPLALVSAVRLWFVMANTTRENFERIDQMTLSLPLATMDGFASGFPILCAWFTESNMYYLQSSCG